MAILTKYHPRLQELLDRPPRRGEGHRWFYRVSLHFRYYHSEEQCFKLLRGCADRFGDRAVPDAEIWKAVNKAYAATAEEALDVNSWEWPEPDEAEIGRVRAQTEPLPLDPLEIDAGRALPALFAYDELVCAGMSQFEGGTATLQEVMAQQPWRYQFVVPSPMLARAGTSKDGKPSFRCMGNTGRRRYLVVEGDSGTREQQARVLSYLDGLSFGVRLVIVVDSAGKSLHGWFNVEGVPEPLTRAFFGRAVQLGADPHTWTACQWVRMPGGTRYGGVEAPRKQAIVWACDSFAQEVLA